MLFLSDQPTDTGDDRRALLPSHCLSVTKVKTLPPIIVRYMGSWDTTASSPSCCWHCAPCRPVSITHESTAAAECSVSLVSESH